MDRKSMWGWMRAFILSLLALYAQAAIAATETESAPNKVEQTTVQTEVTEEKDKILLEAKNMKKQSDQVLVVCLETLPPKSTRKDLGYCMIRKLYPLAQQGNYVSAFLIGDTFAEIKNLPEAKKWFKYLLDNPKVPMEFKYQIFLRMRELNIHKD